jgi:hypothetical protein
MPSQVLIYPRGAGARRSDYEKIGQHCGLPMDSLLRGNCPGGESYMCTGTFLDAICASTHSLNRNQVEHSVSITCWVERHFRTKAVATRTPESGLSTHCRTRSMIRTARCNCSSQHRDAPYDERWRLAPTTARTYSARLRARIQYDGARDLQRFAAHRPGS